MRRVGITAIIFVLFASVSCAPTKYMPKDLAASMDRVAVLAPLSYIDFQAADNQFYPDDSLSAMSQDILIETLMDSKLPVGKYIPVDYLSLGQTFETTVASLEKIQPKQVPSLTIPPEIDKLLEANGERYGIVVFNTGFVRDIKGYRKELAKDVAATAVTTALAILLGGGVTTYGAPVKNVSRMFAVIYDSQENKAVFYNNTINTNESRSPLDPTDIRRQVDYLFGPIVKAGR